MSTPLVSIITPFFNSEKYISETIDSVLSQVYTNWELILVDDGSTDNSYQVAETFSKNDSRVKVLKREQDPKGVSSARNVGIKESKGDYMIFLDSDDLLYSHCLQQRVGAMESNETLDFAVFQMCMFLPDGTIRNTLSTLEVKNDLQSFLSSKFPWNITCPILRSSFFKEKLIGFDTNFHILEDPELHTRALLLNDVDYKVLYQKEYTDSAYRVDYKEPNIKGELKAAYAFIKLFMDRIKGRVDEQMCRDSFFQYYETLLAHYSGQKDDVIYRNIDIMKKINAYFLQETIISRKVYKRTNYFLQLHKYKLLNNSLVVFLLKKLRFTNFYNFTFGRDNK